MRARADADRIGQAQQVDHQRRLGAKGSVETGLVGFVRHQLDQAQQPLRRGIQLAPFNDHRSGEVVALKQLEAEQAAEFHLRLRFDVAGNQGAARGAQRPRRGLQLVAGKAVDIDLEPCGEVDQRPEVIAHIGDAGDGESIAFALEILATRQQRRVIEGDYIDFEYHDVLWQQLDQIVFEKQGIDIDEGAYLAEHIGQAEFSEGFTDHVGGRRRRCRGTFDMGGVFRRGAEQQFVAGQSLVPVEDRLAADEDFSQLIARWGCLIAHRFRAKFQ